MNGLRYLPEAQETVCAMLGNNLLRVGFMEHAWRRFARENPEFSKELLGYAEYNYGQSPDKKQAFLDSCVVDIAIAQTAADFEIFASELQPAAK
jgi:hypothetical protein